MKRNAKDYVFSQKKSKDGDAKITRNWQINQQDNFIGG
jgi:hypothetical protein